MLNQFGQMEQKRLSTDMRYKLITLCEDETFTPRPCLVGIEPVSNFIFVEEYASEAIRSNGTKAPFNGYAI